MQNYLLVPILLLTNARIKNEFIIYYHDNHLIIYL